MYTYKYIILCILFLTAIPCTVLNAQETAADSTSAADSALITELDNQYDSIITKAALSLTGAQYQQAADFYKEASLLKPEDTYPLKMIKYVETIMADAAEKQKRADDLKRRAQIKDDLNKANNAIVNRSWDSARALFSQIIALHPDKADEDYAKSKIEAIDLEQKRIILRTPPKPQPVVIAPPKNRSEARARRKLAERNAAMAAAAAAMPAQQAQAPLPAKNAAVAPAMKETFQKQTAALPPQKTAATAAPAAKQVPVKPAASPLPTKNVAVAAPTVREVPKQSAATASLGTNVAAAPATKETYHAPAAQLPPQSAAAAATVVKEVPKLATALPSTNVAAAPAIKEVYHAPAAQSPAQSAAMTAPVVKEVPKTATALPSTNVAAAPATKEVYHAPAAQSPAQSAAAAAPTAHEAPKTATETALPAANPPAAAQVKAAPQKPVTAYSPPKKVTVAAPVVNNTQPQTQQTEVSLPEKTGAAPLTNETPANASLLKLSDSSDYIKIICKDISFIGTNAYVKVLIQNYSSTESFNTDTLQVSIRKNNGSVRKLDQRFISSFPVVTPLQETILVAFTDASAGVEPNDIFILEMRNRRNKTKFALQIPWALYQEQKNL